MTMQETFDSFILSRQLADLTEKSIDDYRQFISPFVRFIGSDSDFYALSRSDVDKYIMTIINRPLSRSTRSTYIRHVKIYLRWCEREYDVDLEAKSIKVPKSPKREVRIYTDDEISLIFRSISCDEEWITIRNRCIISLMYDSGLRQSEVCSIKCSCISFTDNSLIVRGKGDKERIVHLGGTSQDYLKQYIQLCPFHSNVLFVNRRGDPLSSNAVKLMVNKLASELPFELSSHKLRHNFATNYCLDQYKCKGQVDIYSLMHLMGHQDLKTTERYLHNAQQIIASRTCISHLDGICI